jgi:biotin carboxylase
MEKKECFIEKKKVAVLGASSESIYAIKKAKAYGAHVIALDGSNRAEGLKYADESYVIDIRDSNAVFSILDKKNIKAVLPVPIGRMLTLTGQVNERYNLIGINSHVADFCTDKWFFHNTLNDMGLRCIDCYLLNSETVKICQKKFSNNKSLFPVIVKPRFGAGSRSVTVFNDFIAFNNGIKKLDLKNEDFIIEKLVVGSEFGVDGVVINGKFKLILLRKKYLSALPYRQCIAYEAVDDLSVQYKNFSSNLCFQLQSIADSINLETCIIHADIIRVGNTDTPFIIEMSARPSGHYLHNLFTPMASGCDYVGNYIRFLLDRNTNVNKLFESSNKKNMMIHYFYLSSGTVTNLPSAENNLNISCLKKYECNIQLGDYLEKVTDGHSIMGRGYFILEGNTESMLNAAGQILHSFQIQKG